MGFPSSVTKTPPKLKDKKAVLWELCIRGGNLPKDQELLKAFKACSFPSSRNYDREFTNAIRARAPRWFPKRARDLNSKQTKVFFKVWDAAGCKGYKDMMQITGRNLQTVNAYAQNTRALNNIEVLYRMSKASGISLDDLVKELLD